MSILADCHLHSFHSGDSETPMEEEILRAIELGLNTLCFTEHNDFDYPAPPEGTMPEGTAPEGAGNIFLLNTDSYLYDLIHYKEKYAGQIRILFGVELGLQPEAFRQNAVYAKSYDFDFIIGSSHVCHGRDPYYPSFYEGRSDEAAYREYFESELENIRKFSNFDVYGHLDYIVRYGMEKDNNYRYEMYADIFDKILEALIEKGKGLEVNTGGVKKGLKDLHPCMGVLKRYRELGGEIVTVGSDAHDAAHIAEHFDQAREALLECGFQYYAVFEKRSPEFHKL